MHIHRARSTAVAIALLILLRTSSVQAAPDAAPAPTVAEQYLLTAANDDRSRHGLNPVRADSTLRKAALFHAEQMAVRADISHQFPGEPELSERGSAAGVRFSLITENVAEAPTSITIHNMWMHSEGHRANLLDPDVNVVGIAIVVRQGQLYAVEDFARIVDDLPLEQQEATVAAHIISSGLHIAPAAVITRDQARKTCSMDTGYAGTRRPWFIMRFTAATLNEIPSALNTRLKSGKYGQAAIGACLSTSSAPFTAYNIAVLLYP